MNISSLRGPGMVLFVVLNIMLLSPAAFGQEAGFDEKVGQCVPAGLVFHDESGKDVKLGEIIDKPAILTLVYYSCSHLCPQVLAGLAQAVGELRLSPLKDYSVITVSIDDADTPRDAAGQKRNYIKAVNAGFPESSWRFLTGSKENIRQLSEAVGIRFMKAEHGFIHPEIVVILSPKGKITRYINISSFNYGSGNVMSFSAFELAAALEDASKEKVAAGVKAAPVYCSLHKPPKQDSFFNVLKAAGGITVFIMITLFVYLKSGKRSG